MSERGWIAGELSRVGVVAIVRTESPDGVVEAAEALLRGGVRALEITLSVPGAIECLRRVAREVPEILLGAGTVTRVSEVHEVLDAGARYVISPVFSREVLRAAHGRDAVAIPGCFTPTEMFEATEAGADFVKLFPAGGLGPRYLRDVLAPLRHLRVIPTGGVTAENAGEWIRAGATAVGAATSLVDGALLRARDFSGLERRARAFSEAVESARTSASS